MTQSVIQTQVENKRLFQTGTRKTKETNFFRKKRRDHEFYIFHEHNGHNEHAYKDYVEKV